MASLGRMNELAGVPVPAGCGNLISDVPRLADARHDHAALCLQIASTAP